jgi:hypothetical protein
MKKNFFKKLSFVLALAMIISTIAPAAGAFAAEALHLNSTKKYLHLSPDSKYGPSEFDFNISHATRGSKAAWLSSDEDVATVDETTGYVVATGVGTATISVEVTAKDGTVTPLEATVVVRDNIDSIDSIYCQTDAAQDLTKLAVGKDYDFGRKYTTEAGLHTGTGSKTRWFVNAAATKATINDAGVFKATAAGDYTLTCVTFQSTEKAEAWEVAFAADPASTLNVLASKTQNVTVVPSVLATSQVDLDTFKVTFDCDMSASTFASTAVLYQILNDKEITTGAEKIKTVTFDTATGKEATIDVLAPFSSGVTYKLVSGALVATFKAASTDIADVKSIVFDDFTVNVNGTPTDMHDSVKGLNADGAVIKTGADADFAGLVSFSYGGDATKGFTNDDQCFIYTAGYSTTVTATFSNWIYDDAKKEYVEVKATDSAVATGVETDTSIAAGSISFAINHDVAAADGDTTGWNTTFSVPSGDPVFEIHYRYKTNDDLNNFKYDDAGFTFKTDNPDKLLVFDNNMVPIAQGSVVVLVLKDGKTVTAFTVNIAPARTFVLASFDKSGITLGNSTDVDAREDRTVTISGKDSQGDVVTPTIDAVEIERAPVGVDKAAVLANFGVTVPAANSDGSQSIQIFGSNGGTAVTPGAYTFLVTVGSGVLGTTKQVRFTTIVLDAFTNPAVVRWSFELSSNSVELKDITGNTTVNADVYGYNAAGARVIKVDHSNFTAEVQYNGAGFGTRVDGALGTLGVTAGAPGLLSLYGTGTYFVTYKAADNNPAAGVTNVFNNKAVGMVVGNAQLSVTDSTTTATSIKTSSVSAATVVDVDGAVQAAIEFKLNDNVIVADGAHVFTYFTSDGSAVVAPSAGAGLVIANSTLYVDHVTVVVTVAAGVTRTYSIDVKKTIAIK